MRAYSRVCFSAWVACFLTLSVNTSAWGWSGDNYLNTTVNSSTGDQLYPSSASDGAGGVVIAWEDRRASDGDIYAQRIAASGEVMWATNGIAVSAVSMDSQNAPLAVSDGSGGVYVAWTNSTSGEIYLQRLDASGNPVTGWSAGGMVVSGGSGNNANPIMLADGSGGVLIAWTYYDPITSADIYAQHIDSDGSVHSGWSAGGMPVITASQGQYNQQMALDGAGGVIVIWGSFSGDDKIHAQRLDTSGAPLWAATGVEIAAASTPSKVYPVITSDGAGGAIIAWEDWRTSSDYGDLYGQRINSSGVEQWGTTGLAIATHTGSYQDQINILSDGAGGAYLAWRDSRNSDLYPNTPAHYDIYLHRIDSSGASVSGWTADGTLLSIADTSRNQTPVLVSDGSGGVVVSWWENPYPMTRILAQRVASDATVQWSTGGIVVSDKPGYGINPVIVSDGDGGADIAWRNREVAGDFNIFAQRIYSDGSFSSVATPTTVSPTGGEESSLTPTLTAAAFNDSAVASTQAGAQWRVLDYAEPAADRPQARASLGNMADGDVSYTLPFNFPFYGRTITAISVNRNGMIELLEAGESCQQCTNAGVHQSVDYSAMDVIFASNDNITADDGYVNVYHGGDHVMVEWYGQTGADGGGGAAFAAFMPSGIAPSTGITNPLHFQVLLYSNGAIAWNFQQMDFVSYDSDMYSGVHAAGGSDVDVGLALTAPASYLFNPSGGTVSTVAYNWDDPADYIVYDSGETAVDLTSHDVPSTASLLDGQTYYWAVRHLNNLGDWTEWSVADSFTTPAAATPPPADEESSGGGGLFHPFLVLLLGLLWWVPVNSEGRRRWSK